MAFLHRPFDICHTIIKRIIFLIPVYVYGVMKYTIELTYKAGWKGGVGLVGHRHINSRSYIDSESPYKIHKRVCDRQRMVNIIGVNHIISHSINGDGVLSLY